MKISKMAKKRVQFDFSERALTRLDEIVSLSGANSRAEAIRHALQWYEWLVKLHEEGHKFYAKPKGEKIMKEIPFLGEFT